jgi:hypothetical protein
MAGYSAMGRADGTSGMARRGNGSPAPVAQPVRAPSGLELIRPLVRIALALHIVIVAAAAVVFYPLIGPYWVMGLAVLWSGIGVIMLNNHLAVRENQLKIDANPVKKREPRFQPRRSNDTMGVFPTDDEIRYREGEDDIDTEDEQERG